MNTPIKLADLLGNAIPAAMDTKGDTLFLTDCADSRYLRAHLEESELKAFHRWQQSGRRAVDFPWSDEALAKIDFELGVLVRLRDLMAEAKSAITSPALLSEAERMRKGREDTASFEEVKGIHARMMKGGTFDPPVPTGMHLTSEEAIAAFSELGKRVDAENRENSPDFPESVEESQMQMLNSLRAQGLMSLEQYKQAVRDVKGGEE